MPSPSLREAQLEKKLTTPCGNVTETGVTAERGWHGSPLMSPNALALIILITAILARIYIYLRAPSLWFDEIVLSMNVITHPLLALTHKLDFEQFAPLGFIWMQRLIVDCAGASERTLRLFPLIAGCLSVIAVWDMARRFLDQYAALTAAALIGFAPFALRYSNEAKQYGLELFITAMLLWLASYLGDMPRKPRIQAAVIAAGIVACLLSIPAVFVLAGLWASYAAMALQAENRRRALIFVGLAGFIWSAAFGIIYVTILVPHQDAYLRRFWLPLDLSVHLRDVNLGSVIMHGFLDPCLSLPTIFDSWIPRKVFAAGCIGLILGVYAIRKLRGSQVALLFVTPLVLCLAAALAGKWYLAPRLMMFTAPLCVVLIAATISWITKLAERLAQLLDEQQKYADAQKEFSAQVRLIAAVAIVAFPLEGGAYWVRHPTVEDPRGAVEFCQRTMQPGDGVYVSVDAMPGWIFYSTNWARVDRARYNWLKRATEEGSHWGGLRWGLNGGNIHRGHRKVSEGLDLWHRYGQSIELAGVSPGIFYDATGAAGDPNPDPGWSDNEVQRILAARRRRIVLLAYGTRDTPEVSTLLDCLGRNGGAIIGEFRSKNSLAEVIEMRGSQPGVLCSN